MDFKISHNLTFLILTQESEEFNTGPEFNCLRSLLAPIYCKSPNTLLKEFARIGLEKCLLRSPVGPLYLRANCLIVILFRFLATVFKPVHMMSTVFLCFCYERFGLPFSFEQAMYP